MGASKKHHNITTVKTTVKESIQTSTNVDVEKIRKKVNAVKIHEKMPLLSIRFDNYRHYPDFDDERRGFRCKYNKCGKQTTIFCEKCKVHLCFVPGRSNRGRNCFKKFHELEEN